MAPPISLMQKCRDEKLMNSSGVSLSFTWYAKERSHAWTYTHVAVHTNLQTNAHEHTRAYHEICNMFK